MFKPMFDRAGPRCADRLLFASGAALILTIGTAALILACVYVFEANAFERVRLALFAACLAWGCEALVLLARADRSSGTSGSACSGHLFAVASDRADEALEQLRGAHHKPRARPAAIAAPSSRA
jgi:hypothetical protein